MDLKKYLVFILQKFPFNFTYFISKSLYFLKIVT